MKRTGYDEANAAALEGLAAAAGRAAWRAARPLVLGVLKVLLPALLPLAAVLALFLFAYAAVFVLPKYIVEDAKGAAGKVVAIFTTGEKDDPWTTGKDAELAAEYRALGERWREGLEDKQAFRARLGPDWEEEIRAGLILSEEEQAEPYRLPWAVLAGVDRILGDPYVHRRGPEREPDPEKAWKALRPVFRWREPVFTKTIVEPDGTTRVVHARVRLLEQADTYEATYRFSYAKKVIERENETAEIEVLAGVEKEGPFFKRLKDYMAAGGITDPLDVEGALRLAMTFDESYAADLELLATVDYGFAVDLTRQYWQGPEGTRTAPLPLQFMGRVTSGFGMRIHPVYGIPRFHDGVDIAAPEGTPVFAFTDGVVVYAGRFGGYGLAVVLDHGAYKTLYGHLSEIAVRPGTEVASGQKIGEVGSTGVSTGPHLHFSVWEIAGGRMRPVDPMGYLGS